MGRRGRRPHPDILTPREWEVLGLLREHLTNEQIAERLGITLDGAKYHVSEILSKLGVGTREEAAAWRAEAGRPWWRGAMALPVAAGAAGVITVLAAGVAIALLTWGAVVTTDDSPVSRYVPPELPAPKRAPQLTRDQALLRGTLGVEGEIVFVDAQPSTLGAALRYLDGPIPAEIELADRQSPVTAWLVILVGQFDQFGGAALSVPPGPTPVLETACREVSVVFADDESGAAAAGTLSGFAVGPGLPEGNCRPPTVSRDLAVVLGARSVANRNQSYLTGAALVGLLPREIPAKQMDFSEAANSILEEGGLIARSNKPVWLIRYRGAFFDPSQFPGQRVVGIDVCSEVVVILHTRTGEPALIRGGSYSC